MINKFRIPLIITLLIGTMVGAFLLVRMWRPVITSDLPMIIEEKSLVKKAKQIVPAGATAIIISESEFNRALSTSNFYQVDELIKEKAVELNASANDPATLGVLGKLQKTEQRQKFSGTLFLVVRNPTLIAKTGYIQSTDYFVATVELSGEASWIATTPSFAIGSSSFLSGEAGRCCGPKTICVDASGQNGGCGPTGYCGKSGMGISQVKPPALEDREQRGNPVVNLVVYGDKPPNFSESNPISSANSQILNGCLQVRDTTCDVGKITQECVLGQTGYTEGPNGKPDYSSGSTLSSNCLTGTSSSSGNFGSINDVPKFCTLINVAENLPPECGGYGENLGKPPQVNPFCTVAKPEEGSNICRDNSDADNKFLQNEIGWIDKRNPEAKEVCLPADSKGFITCTRCDESGKCGQYVKKPMVNPNIANACQGTVGCNLEEEADVSDDCYWKGECELKEEADVSDDCYWKGECEFAPETIKETEVDTPTPPTDSPPSKAPTVWDMNEPSQLPLRGEEELQPSFIPDKKANDVFKPKNNKRGDPVLLGDGSFSLEQVDLSFAGVVRSFDFRRMYNSRDHARSTLGSNWTHNWDVYLQILNADNTPTWALPYCAGSGTKPFCLLLHDREGGERLFYRNGESGLYMPQAGNTDVIAEIAQQNPASTNDGWALRSADNHLQVFNQQGYLVKDRDRFGNGFTIEYERTPLYDLYDHTCSPNALAVRQETKYSRRCAVLSYLLDDGILPDPSDKAWKVTAKDYEPLPNNLIYARDYFLYLVKLGPDAHSIFGARRLRPTRVVDDLGRTLTFSYYQAPKFSSVSSSGSNTVIYDFASQPDAELLKEVRGPAGTVLSFKYERPTNYPLDLNELFLIQVERKDAPTSPDLVPAQDRIIQFTYQWPQNPSPQNPVASYNGFAVTVYEKYKAYYQTFVNCWFQGFLCTDQWTPPIFVRGNPEALARREQNGYISDVADNIIKVVRFGVVESETRYTPDPMDMQFDRVRAQRYGSSQAKSITLLTLSDQPGDKWETSLPKALFNYQSAGPLSTAGDLTDQFLPAEIKTRYPMESVSGDVFKRPPRSHPGQGIIVMDLYGKPMNACNYGAMDSLLSTLPGYQETVPYSDPVPSQKHPNFSLPIYRTQLTCDQLAEKQVNDPGHNDLLGELIPITTTETLTDHIWQNIVGRRSGIAANLNRICAWTSVTDRDGDLHYYGLNYWGQALVDAVQERISGSFIFTEKLYNADGMVVQERRPTRGSQAWQPNDGSTNYTYDEVNPTGNSGWNGWLPFYWSRRMNLVRVEEHPAGLAVLDENGTTNATFVKSLGRYQQIGYEPLFNQIKFVEEGSLAPRSGSNTLTEDIPTKRLEYVYDYQELDLSDSVTPSSSMEPVLDYFMPWGFPWIMKEGSKEYDYDQIKLRQIPLQFYKKDVNGDGILGFGPKATGATTSWSARGVPIVAILFNPTNTAGSSETTIFTWAPHGQLASIRGPDGTLQVFEYYSQGTAQSPSNVIYGQNRAPTSKEISSGYRGLLARIRTLRFPLNYPVSYGPPDTPCAALAGPYQWMLPANCPADLKTALLQLGLPEETVTAIISSTIPNSPNRWLSVSFSYSEIGQPRYIWTDTGETHLISDPDGRLHQLTDPLTNTRSVTYTIHGDPEREVLKDAKGVLLKDTLLRYDEEGRVIYECAAKAPGGCEPFGTTQPASGTVQTYTYWPEGNLYQVVDPEGTVSEFEYDERKLLKFQRTYKSGSSQSPRFVTYNYNLDGDLVKIRYGDPLAPDSLKNILIETYVYDGLRRLITYTDTRKYAWQYAYSGQDLLTHLKRSDNPYGPATTDHPNWEIFLEYDALGRQTSRYDNGHLTARLTPTEGGWIASQSAEGYGTTYTTYDLSGQPVWSRDAAGNQTVATWMASPHIATQSQILVGQGNTQNKTQTISSILSLDPTDLPTRETIYSAGNTQVWNWLRDGTGSILEERNPEGYITKYIRNMLGWPEQIHQQRTSGTNPKFDVSNYIYNQRGQVISLKDPAGQETVYHYDDFGALEFQQTPGNPIVIHSFHYDDLGRIEIETIGAAKIKYDYDQRGDLVMKSYEQSGSWIPLSEWTFDDLGRVKDAKNFNPALFWLDVDSRTVTQHFDYDNLGQVTTDRLQVGLSPQHEVISTWSLNQQDVWQREFKYNAGVQTTIWTETFDPKGRMASKARLLPNGGSLETTFQWLGNLYTGRQQQQEGHSSLFRELRELDSFGLPLRWVYSAVDLDQNQNPLDQQEGDTYCGGTWNTQKCSNPLLKIDVLRDVVGRIASLQWQFGHPVMNGSTVSTDHPAPWRGYTYNPLGQLAQTWEQAGSGRQVSTKELSTHKIRATDIQKLGKAANADPWEYTRVPFVGDTLSIHNPVTGEDRWSSAGPRGPGHQLQSVTIDGNTRALSYDPAGRIVGNGGFGYMYDPRGQLALVVKGSIIFEAYAYDASGRLAGVYKVPNPIPPTHIPKPGLVNVFTYDGDQIVATFASEGTVLWEAAWGPSMDQLIEIRDHISSPGDYIPLVDHRNSVMANWNVKQSRITQTADYNPEGRIELHDPKDQVVCIEVGTGNICPNPDGMPFGFLSAYRSSTSGLVFLRNRWYSPDLAQFVSQDTMGYLDSFNSYAYVGSDPINGWDPYGLKGKSFHADENLNNVQSGKKKKTDEGVIFLDREGSIITPRKWVTIPVRITTENHPSGQPETYGTQQVEAVIGMGKIVTNAGESVGTYRFVESLREILINLSKGVIKTWRLIKPSRPKIDLSVAAAEIQNALLRKRPTNFSNPEPAHTKRVTAVVEAIDEAGNTVYFVASSAGKLTPAQVEVVERIFGNARVIMVKGVGHAEVQALEEAAKLGFRPIGVGASRLICPGCALYIGGTDAIPDTPLKFPN